MANAPYPFNQKSAPSSLLAQTFDGTPGGMNMALPPHEIDDTQARMMVDWLVDQPGITRQRGPIQPASGVPALPRGGCGLFATLDPQGNTSYAALSGDVSNGYFSVLKPDLSGWVDLAWPFALPATSPYRIVDAKPALGGGLLIGVASDYGSAASVSEGIAYWFGGTKPNWAATGLSCVRGAQAVTGSGFLANVTPGMFLFANTDDPYTNAYVGIVQSVNSDTSVTLISPSPYSLTTKAGTFQSIRGITPKVTVGEITTDTSSTTVTGGATKFLSQGLSNGTWQIYRASDGAFVGKVSTVNSELSLTLASNAAVSMASEPYLAIRADADFSIINTANTQKVGFLNATYANRQWFANRGSSFDTTSQVWFSDSTDLEGLDVSAYDGNWLDITNSSSVNEPIRAIAAAYNGLLVFKETETFIIGGSSPASFDVRKLEDDGTLCGMSVEEYGGGVIWAGREGINLYDGVQVTNLVEGTLGQVWKDTIRTLDPKQYRLWSMMDRDHYFLFLENVAPTWSIVKGNVSSTPTRITVVINMITRAVTFGSNIDLRGAAVLPATASRHAWFLVNGNKTDSYTTLVQAAGPSLHWRLGERSGTVAADSSGHGNNGVYGPGMTLGHPGALSGDPVAKSAYSTPSLNADNAQGGYIDSSYQPFVIGSQRTFMGWSYINTYAVTGGPVLFGQPIQGWVFLWIKGDGTGDVKWSPQNIQTWAGAWPGLNQWVHWAITHDDTTHVSELFINGVSKGTRTGTLPYFINDKFQLGCDDGLAGYFQDVAVFERILTSTEIQNIHAEGVNPAQSGFVCDGDALFIDTGHDAINCNGNVAGPSVYLESKKFDAGDGMRLKRWKLVAMNYLAQGGGLDLDVVLGLNEIGQTASTTFPESVFTWTSLSTNIRTWTDLKNQYPTWTNVIKSVFFPARIRMQKKSQFLSFRIYGTIPQLTDAQIGPYEVSYKLQRVGRV